jgi:hypothetical protein
MTALLVIGHWSLVIEHSPPVVIPTLVFGHSLLHWSFTYPAVRGKLEKAFPFLQAAPCVSIS